MATRSTVLRPNPRSKSAVIIRRLRAYRFNDQLFDEPVIPRKVVPIRKRGGVR
jgi:hypothetical protein